MSKKHQNPSKELDSFPTWREAEDQVLVEFSYMGEGGGWVIVPVGPAPRDIPTAQRRYAMHMGWMAHGSEPVNLAEDPVILRDTEDEEVDHDPEVIG